MQLTTILIIGAILLAVVWVLQNPHVIGDLFKGAQDVRAEVVKIQTQVQEPDRPVTSSSSVDTQFLDLRKGEIVSIDLSGANSVTGLEHIIGCVGTLIALNRSGQEFRPNGDTYSYFETDEQPGSIVVMKRPDCWLLLTKRTIMPGETIKQFDKLAEIWGDKDHRQLTDDAHMIELPWGNEQWRMFDEGYMDFQQRSGSGHLEAGTRIKYYIATIGERVMYVEHVKPGTNSVWEGTKTDSLDGYVTKVLRASA